MKLVSLLTVSLILGMSNISKPLVKEAGTTYEKNYIADFSSVPSSFKKYEKSDAGNSTISVKDNNLIIEHATNTSVGNPNYYGAFYNIAAFDEPIGDFEMSITFKVISALNNTRWLGLVYHTKTNASNMLSGYLFGARMSGATWHSEINNTPAFTDTLKNDSTSNPIQNTNYHTMKVVCSGDDITYTLDSNNVINIKLSEYSSTLTDVQYSGGFGLIINKCSVQISEFKISGNTGDSVEHKEVDETIADTYSPNINSSLITDVAVNKWVKSLSDLTDYKDANVRPANLIMDVDNEMNVIDEDGNSLGVDIEKAYSQYMKGKIIPVVNIDTKEKQNAFIEYYPKKFNLIDMAVISNDFRILKNIKTSISQIRTIYDIRDKNIDDSLTLLQEANKGQALTLLMSSKQANKKTVEFFQYRLKAVIVDMADSSKASAFAALTSGAFGVISEDITATFEDFDLVKSKDLNNFTTRTPANVAHRGLCLSECENSLEAFVAAYESGATHFELDVQMSKDGHLVVMHDDSIDRTTNGTGKVSSMTTTDLSKYKITKNYQGKIMGYEANIPLLEDVFAEFEDKDAIIFVEIKTGHAQCVPVLRDLIDEYNMYEHAVVISFDRNQLKNMKSYLPEIPTADLNTYSASTFASGLVTMGAYACGIDIPANNFTSQFIKMCVARGIAPWGWTFNYGNDIMNGWTRGIMGLTNNSANYLSSFAREVSVMDKYLIISDDAEFEDIEPELEVTAFDGSKIEGIYGEAVMVEDHEDYALIVFAASYLNPQEVKYYTLFTDIVKVVREHAHLSESEVDKVAEIINSGKDTLNDEEVSLLKKYSQYSHILNEEDQKVDVAKVDALLANYKPAQGGCGGSIIAVSSLGISLLALTGALIIKRKKKAQK